MTLTSTEAKYLAMASIGLGSFLVGIIPACFTNRNRERTLILSSLLCFGAGVLISTSLLHMLPDTRKSLPDYAELIFCAGFLLVYLVDEIVNFFERNDNPSIEVCSHQPTIVNRPEYSHGLGHSHDRAPYGLVKGPCGSSGIVECRRQLNDVGYCHSVLPPYVPTAPTHELLRQSHIPNAATIVPRVQNDKSYQYGGFIENRPSTSKVPNRLDNETDTLLCQRPHADQCSNTRTRLLDLLLALTLHAILEGLAIGLQKKSDEVLLLLAAVASHKIVVGFCLGVEMMTTVNSILKHTIAIGLFASGSVGGIGIGMIVSGIKKSWATELLMPILQGLAGGSLLYVAFGEILPRERACWQKDKKRSAGLIQFLSITSGILIMFVLNKCVGESS